MTDKPSVLRETDDAARKQARILLRSARHAALAVIEPGSDGFPFVSRVLLGMDIDGTPVILVSALSTHTQALAADPRCSLLTGDIGKGDPLAHARLTVQCEAARVPGESPDHVRIRERFIRRHPKAQLYVDFPDFSFFRLVPLRASMNGGFGRAFLMEAQDLRIESPATAELQAMEASAIEHMNSDHADAAGHYARTHCGAKGETWQIRGIDAAGIDLASGDQLKRLEFDAPLQNASGLRPLLKKLNG
ncbi:HugZ family protein [Pararhizobium antarcticum]|uniref:Pyridoxamine 5'-phosphate oxidase n=1 Tax=Pararhizobium antarcticum TaxID=1798805 RepID=A0A657LTT2_9HYPH|nr:HugZ family protein [Pararhizobium antarcticum]OJF92996.1 pyridoxamine 5'-phosphate oxidase [Rhizobium sp. 58]OJF96968.1 pyridoxamine 5'-phosphate oxidase [Pararhizobium antarcticum]